VVAFFGMRRLYRRRNPGAIAACDRLGDE